MKQRLGIAMAILDAPALLVLDEPMNGLDPLGMADLREFLRSLPKTTGAGVMVSSHLLNEIEQICDRVLFIRDGRLIGDRTIDSVHGDGRQVLRLRTSDDARAETVLRECGVVDTVERQPTGILCRVRAEEVGAIAQALVAAQVQLLELVPLRLTLEDVYVSNYRDGTRSYLS